MELEGAVLDQTDQIGELADHEVEALLAVRLLDLHRFDRCRPSSAVGCFW